MTNSSLIDSLLAIEKDLDSFKSRNKLLYELVKAKLEESITNYNNELSRIQRSLSKNTTYILDIINEYTKQEG